MSSAEASTRSLQSISPVLTSNSCAFTRPFATCMKPAEVRHRHSILCRTSLGSTGCPWYLDIMRTAAPPTNGCAPAQLSRRQPSEFIEARGWVVIQIFERKNADSSFPDAIVVIDPSADRSLAATGIAASWYALLSHRSIFAASAWRAPRGLSHLGAVVRRLRPLVRRWSRLQNLAPDRPATLRSSDSDRAGLSAASYPDLLQTRRQWSRPSF